MKKKDRAKESKKVSSYSLVKSNWASIICHQYLVKSFIYVGQRQIRYVTAKENKECQETGHTAPWMKKLHVCSLFESFIGCWGGRAENYKFICKIKEYLHIRRVKLHTKGWTSYICDQISVRQDNSLFLDKYGLEFNNIIWRIYKVCSVDLNWTFGVPVVPLV